MAESFRDASWSRGGKVLRLLTKLGDFWEHQDIVCSTREHQVDRDMKLMLLPGRDTKFAIWVSMLKNLGQGHSTSTSQ